MNFRDCRPFEILCKNHVFFSWKNVSTISAVGKQGGFKDAQNPGSANYKARTNRSVSVIRYLRG